MRRYGSRIIIASFVAALAAGSVPADDTLEWRNPKESLRLARAESRPLIMSWETTWCPYCKKMRSNTWSDPGVMGAMQGFVSLIADADKYEGLANSYGVELYPTIVFAAPTGEPMLVLRGYQKPTEMYERILAVWKQRERLYDLAVRAAGKKPEGAALLGLAAFAARNEVLPYAEVLLRRALAIEKTLDPPTATEARHSLASILVLTSRCTEAETVVSGVPRPVPEPFTAVHALLEEKVATCEG